MKNAHFQPKRSTTANAGITLSTAKINVAIMIANQLLGPVDPFNLALVRQQLNNSTQAEMAGHWSHVKNQRYLNHLIGQYYIANND